MSYIHSTAVVHPDVELGVNVWVGPYVVLGYPGESRLEPQAKRNPGNVVIGDDAEIHEHAHIQSGIYGTTVLGDDVLVMAGVHIGHDAQIGSHATLSSSCVLGGHCVLGAYAVIGLGAVLHQRAHVGCGTMVGAQSFFKGSTGMWELWYGNPAKRKGYNRVGWARYMDRVTG